MTDRGRHLTAIQGSRGEARPPRAGAGRHGGSHHPSQDGTTTPLHPSTAPHTDDTERGRTEDVEATATFRPPSGHATHTTNQATVTPWPAPTATSTAGPAPTTDTETHSGARRRTPRPSRPPASARRPALRTGQHNSDRTNCTRERAEELGSPDRSKNRERPSRTSAPNGRGRHR